MGWSVRLQSDKEITQAEISEMVKCIPGHLKSKIPTDKQDWGWALATNLHNPEDKEIKISGPFICVDKARPMLKWLKKQLSDRSHTLKKGKWNY